MDLRPLAVSDYDLLHSLQEQDDVWESIGALPLPQDDEVYQMFAILEGQERVGFAGLIRSPALEGKDVELLCALREEAQQRGLAKHACELVLAWAFEHTDLERVISCIDDANEAARAIALKLGMRELGPAPPNRTVYVKYRS